MSVDPLEELSAEQLDFLIKLAQGQTAREKEVNKEKQEQRKKDLLEKHHPTYVLQKITVCGTCHRSTVKFFRMTYSSTHRGYVSSSIAYMPLGVEAKRSISPTMTCPCCATELGKLPKEIIIKMLLRNRAEIVSEYLTFAKEIEYGRE